MSTSFSKLQNDVVSMAGLSRQSSTGFYEMDCPVCASAGKKRQGGFKLESDKIIYNCFSASCDAACVYEENQPISRKFRNMMDIIGVKIPVDLRAKKSSIQLQIEKELTSSLYEKHTYKEVPIPDGWIPLSETDSYWKEYFDDRRCDHSDMLFITDGLYRGCVAIPMKFYNRIIGFQIATVSGLTKYITYSGDNDHLIMINNGIIKQQVLLVEGILDAKCFPNTVAIMRGNITEKQAYHLIGKDVIVMPDRHSGDRLLKQAETYKWKVLVPPWNNVFDLNDCVVIYGKLATAKMIAEHTYTDYTKATIAYKLWKQQKG